MKLFFERQHNAMDCGPCCLVMIARYYGKNFSVDGIKKMAGFNKEGVSLLGITEAAENIGFRTKGTQLNFKELITEAPLPAILHWNQNHFVVLLPSKTNSIFPFRSTSVKIADPARGVITYTKEEFLKQWINTHINGEEVGVALLLEPTPLFFKQKSETENKLSWKKILIYLRPCRPNIIKVFIILAFSSIFQFVFPFLTRDIVDYGIRVKNLNFVILILIGQLMLILSRAGMEFFRTQFLFRISKVINLSMLSAFWQKLTQLPLSYFENHHTGDTLQRLADHRQIEKFLTGVGINTFFSLFNFIIFSIVLITYGINLFIVFVLGSLLFFLWVVFFLKVRKKINYQLFDLSVKENNVTLQLVQGMKEIKLYSAQDSKRREWEELQKKFYSIDFKNTFYTQIQQGGGLVLNEGKNLFITFLVAKLVIEGQLTLGTMLAVQYIIGQLSSPVEQLINFLQSGQDAKLSIKRLNEIHYLTTEEKKDTQYTYLLPINKTIVFENVSFTYPGAGNEPVLKNIHLEIPEGKITAIVGISGSGKTTLLKLLLRFFESYKGRIMIGNENFLAISPSYWRKQCGAVLQEGFIFSDSILKNIIVNDDTVEHSRLEFVCEIANILSFIESLPYKFDTKLGPDGTSLSEGQKQRLLIARSIYKNPQFLFFDEATNSLDANNEKIIIQNLQNFLIGRTVLIVAHRLSTVKNADKIVVLENGYIVEEGDHKSLSALKGKYYELVKNQLELGS